MIYTFNENTKEIEILENIQKPHREMFNISNYYFYPFSNKHLFNSDKQPKFTVYNNNNLKKIYLESKYYLRKWKLEKLKRIK